MKQFEAAGSRKKEVGQEMQDRSGRQEVQDRKCRTEVQDRKCRTRNAEGIANIVGSTGYENGKE